MRKRFAALLCALAVTFGGVAVVAPSAEAAGAWRCFYKHYPRAVDTDNAGAAWLRSTGSWLCYYKH